MASAILKSVWPRKWWKFCVILASTASCAATEAPSIAEYPSTEIFSEDGKTKIAFTGILRSAETVLGPWQEITNADSPYVVDMAGAHRFYSAGSYGTNSIFSSRSVVALNLTGPLQIHFDMAYAGLPDGMIPPVREKPFFDGTLTMPGWVLPVSVRVRGNSSLQECPFPKLKFKVAKEYRLGTPFADARELKIGTHCAEGGRGTIGRLRDQTAAFREVLAYEVLSLMEFVAPRVRRGLVEYHDTTPATNSTSPVGWQIAREAVILEDIELVAERLGGRALSDLERTKLVASDFDTQLSADLQFFNALIGNWDYTLGWDSRGVWNTEVLEVTEGTKTRFIPVAGDFDLASWVTGLARRSAPRDYHPELGDVERETRYKLEEIQKRVSTEAFAAARQRFADQRTAITLQIASTRIDEEGRTNALRHVSAFYDALETMK